VTAGGWPGCCRRPAEWTRTYTAPAVDAAIASMAPRFKDKDLATLWANALPNALDSTVIHSQSDTSEIGPYDTFIVTGDIDAMWQRDSTNQAKPYLRFLKDQKANDTSLTDFFRGLIARQAHNTLLDPYANSFQRTGDLGPNAGSDVSTKRSHSTEGYLQAVESDHAYDGETTDAYVGGIFERKYELDSIANVLHLSAMYFNASAKAAQGQADMVPFNAKWVESVALIIK
jgi:meiotically up-regulated gene 157 (Mug157) protein